MKKALHLLAFLALGLSGCAHAEPQSNSASPALWVVRDADTTIYLFGTIHVLKPETVWFDDEVKAAFDRSKTLVLEMVEPPPAEMAALVQAMAFNPQGPLITEQLSGKAKQDYIATVQKLGQSIDSLDHFDPWLAAVQISIAHIVSLGYSPKAGPESILSLAAKEQGKSIEALETMAFQFGIFDAMPREAQITYLNDSIAQLPHEGRDFKKLMTAWEKGDSNHIAALMADSEEMNPALKDALIYQRNARWAHWIKARMDKPGVLFMAVGAGHLAGKDSVLKGLARMGIRANRVSMKDFAQ